MTASLPSKIERYLSHIAENAERIAAYLNGLDEAAYANSPESFSNPALIYAIPREGVRLLARQQRHHPILRQLERSLEGAVFRHRTCRLFAGLAED